MTKAIRLFTLLCLIMLTPILLNSVFAQDPPHPGGDPTSGENPVGGGASISGGIIILFTLGAGYASKKIYDVKKKK
ncbi:MAG: hypothetical protein K8R58_05900 [Bacteroidales bacterium]|nr:hypothetical protein [Bacteroidales bacterium]